MKLQLGIYNNESAVQMVTAMQATVPFDPSEYLKELSRKLCSGLKKLKEPMDHRKTMQAGAYLTYAFYALDAITAGDRFTVRAHGSTYEFSLTEADFTTPEANNLFKGCKDLVEWLLQEQEKSISYECGWSPNPQKLHNDFPRGAKSPEHGHLAEQLAAKLARTVHAAFGRTDKRYVSALRFLAQTKRANHKLLEVSFKNDEAYANALKPLAEQRQVLGRSLTSLLDTAIVEILEKLRSECAHQGENERKEFCIEGLTKEKVSFSKSAKCEDLEQKLWFKLCYNNVRTATEFPADGIVFSHPTLQAEIQKTVVSIKRALVQAKDPYNNKLFESALDRVWHESLAWTSESKKEASREIEYFRIALFELLAETASKKLENGTGKIWIEHNGRYHEFGNVWLKFRLCLAPLATVGESSASLAQQDGTVSG